MGSMLTLYDAPCLNFISLSLLSSLFLCTIKYSRIYENKKIIKMLEIKNNEPLKYLIKGCCLVVFLAFSLYRECCEMKMCFSINYTVIKR